MCHWCENSLIADSLTSGLWGLAADRRQFMAYAVSAGAVAAASLIPSVPAFAASGAEVIFRNGAIYPMTAARGPAEALAIGRERILAVGSEAEVAALSGPATRIVDLQGRTLLPGLIDPHHHTVLAALLSDVLINVGYAKYPRHDAALTALRRRRPRRRLATGLRPAFMTTSCRAGICRCRSWMQFRPGIRFSSCTSTAMSAPVTRWPSSAAKITENVGQLPRGGHFGRGPDGKLNGLIYEEPALLRFLDVAVSKPTPARMAEAISKYAKQAVPRGNTTLHEPGTVKPEWVEPLARLSTMLPLRLSASFSTDMLDASKAYAAIGPPTKARRIPGSRFSLYGMKFWADGSNQAESAAQTEPYLHSSAKGKANYSVAQMADLCRKAKAAGWPILIHCQGDAAVGDALDAIEQAYGAHPATGINRIEHATMARPDQIDRMKRLGVEPSFIPDFVYLYGAAYRDQLFGARRAEFMVPAGAAAKAGLGFSLHSDNPAAGLPVDPLRHVQTAVTRCCVIDNSIVGLGVALTVDQALRRSPSTPRGRSGSRTRSVRSRRARKRT